MSVKIRKALPSDIRQIIKNMKAVAKEKQYIFIEKVTSHTVDEYRQLVKDDDCLVLVAEADGKTVGHLTLSLYGDVDKARHVRDVSMLIIDDYRGMGIGTQLLEAAIIWARSKRDIKKLVLGVFSNNKQAFKLYQKMGFKLDGVKKQQYFINGKYEDEINMALFLR